MLLGYTDVEGKAVEASDDALVAVLNALGVDVRTPAEAARVDPGDLPWAGSPHPVVAWDGRLGGAGPRRVVTQGGDEVSADTRLPYGYHRSADGSTLVISAPRRLDPPEGRTWGVFMPLYALRTRRSGATGDLADLRALTEWTASVGGRWVATLPLLAQFYDEPFDPSPYSPASRLFHNELYVHTDQEQREAPGDWVDYREAMAAKRAALEPAARALLASGDDPDLGRYVRTHPLVTDYARFRATVEHHRSSWEDWPPGGLVEPGHPAARYHLYVQWLAHRQMEEVVASARRRGVGLYLDMPLGVGRGSYDVWRFRDSFALGARVGAPPDTFFSGGQDWGFPAPHPHRMREDGYSYVRACLGHLLAYAAVLRVDHAMALHRLFWIPEGLDASSGVYVSYRSEELYAVLLLEAHRAGAVVVGEDLGTVPPEVREEMMSHGIHRTYVVQYDAHPDREPVLNPSGSQAVASPNTHDMWPFTAWWRGSDIEDRLMLGFLDAERAADAHEDRAKARRRLSRRWGARRELGARGALRSCLAELASSEARIVVVSLEDLWGETRPQNVPGTTVDRHPSWRRRAALPLEVFGADRRVLDTLKEIDRLRTTRGAG